jgi:hypothetical protein
MSDDLNLRLCPFCGSSTAARVWTASESAAEYGLKEEYASLGHAESYVVVCDFNNDGCGGQSGAGDSREQSIEKWSLRK